MPLRPDGALLASAADWRPRRRLLAAAVAGGVAALGQAPFDLVPLTVLGLAVGVALVATQERRWPAAWTGWALAFGYFLVGWNWLVEPFLVDIATFGWMAPFGITLLSGSMALYWGGAALLARELGQGPAGRLLALVPLLTLAEYFRGHWFTGFPWGMVSYAWIDTGLAQLLAWFGPHGLNLLTFAASAILGLWFLTRRGLLAAGATGLLLVAASLLLQPGLAPPAQEDGPVVRIAQSGASQREKWLPGRRDYFFERLLDDTAAEPAPDLVVWPETSVPYELSQAGSALQMVVEAADGVPVILGGQRNRSGDWLNSMVALSAEGDVAGLYDKMHLVPYGEYLPFDGLMTRLGLNGLAANAGGGFTPGDSRAPLEIEGIGALLPLICYESVFPAEVGAMPERPRAMVLITNDAWFGRFSGPYQHLQQGRARAIEQGLPMIRAAQTGVSAMIDGKGRVTAEIPLGGAGHVDATLPPALAPTLYSRTSDVPVLIFLALALAALLLVRLRPALQAKNIPG